jgi:hypothetical protein
MWIQPIPVEYPIEEAEIDTDAGERATARFRLDG